MRTTIRLDDALLQAAKRRAAADEQTLTALIEDALRQRLAQRSATLAERLTIERFGDAKTLPGVDLDDAVSLRDLMDDIN
jgi:predicted transcriptional regulator